MSSQANTTEMTKHTKPVYVEHLSLETNEDRVFARPRIIDEFLSVSATYMELTGESLTNTRLTLR